MKKAFIIFCFLLLSGSTVMGQCAPNQTKVLVLGDSWAAFCWQFNSHNTIFDKYGLPDRKAYSTGSSVSSTGATDLSQSGAEARSFLTPVKRTAIQNAFTANPGLDIVHISLGGNDFLGEWDTTWTNTQVNTLANQVFDSLTSLINFIKLQKPQIKIFISGYDYANFAESINGNTSHPFYSRWDAMLKPRFIQLNTLLANVNTQFQNYANAGVNLFFVNNIGLMQYVYGQTTPLLVAPGGTYAPMSVPLPGGNPNYPSPLVAMNTYFTIKDAFHLSTDGYAHFTENQVKGYYFEALRAYDETTRNEKFKSGYANASNQFSDTSIIVGNVNNVKHVGVLSFKMPVYAPSKSAQGVSIFMKRKNLVGTNPTGAYALNLAIKAGTLGTTEVPDNGDFSALTNFTSSVCEFGSVLGNNYWMRMDLPNVICQQLASGQTYQFKVSFVGNEANADQAIEFYSNADSANAPILDVHYNNVLSVRSFDPQFISGMQVYPNPSVNNNFTLKFDLPFTGSVEVMNVLGKKVAEVKNNNYVETLQIDLPAIEAGMYFIIAKDANAKVLYQQKWLLQN